MGIITLLHLGDLDFGLTVTSPTNIAGQASVGPSPYAFYRRELAMDSLAQTLQKLPGDWVPNMIAIAGNIAHNALPEQYSQAREWLGEIEGVLGLGGDAVIAVPGTRDRALGLDGRSPLKKIASAQTADLELSMPVFAARREAEFAAFVGFSASAGLPAYMGSGGESWLGGVRALPGGIAAVALNTCLNTDVDGGEVYIGDGVAGGLEKGLEGLYGDEQRAVVGLTHYPPSMVSREENGIYGTSDRFAGMCDIVLAGSPGLSEMSGSGGQSEPGSGNESDNESESESEDAVPVLIAGATATADTYVLKANLVRIDTEAGSYDLAELSFVDGWQFKVVKTGGKFLAKDRKGEARPASPAAAKGQILELFGIAWRVLDLEEDDSGETNVLLLSRDVQMLARYSQKSALWDKSELKGLLSGLLGERGDPKKISEPFILDFSQAMGCFAGDDDRLAPYGKTSRWWWLAGDEDGRYTPFVDSRGRVHPASDGMGVREKHGGVRPALWIRQSYLNEILKGNAASRN